MIASSSATVRTPAQAEENLYAVIQRCLIASFSRVAHDFSFKCFIERPQKRDAAIGFPILDRPRDRPSLPPKAALAVTVVLWKSLGSVGCALGAYLQSKTVLLSTKWYLKSCYSKAQLPSGVQSPAEAAYLE